MDRHADGNALVATARRWAERGLLDAQLFDEHLVLLRHKCQSLLGLFHPLAQHGQRGRVRAKWTAMARLTVAIGLVT